MFILVKVVFIGYIYFKPLAIYGSMSECEEAKLIKMKNEKGKFLCVEEEEKKL